MIHTLVRDISNINNESRYRIFKLIHQNSGVNQRELAKALGVSVGKANYYLKALIEGGWVKTKISKKSQNEKGYLYLLTHQGIKEKARVTSQFMKQKQLENEVLLNEREESRREVSALKTTGERGKPEYGMPASQRSYKLPG